MKAEPIKESNTMLQGSLSEFDHDKLSILCNRLLDLADRLDAVGSEEHLVELAKGVASTTVLVDVAKTLPPQFLASTLAWLIRPLCQLAKEEGGEFEMLVSQAESALWDAIGLTDVFKFTWEYFGE